MSCSSVWIYTIRLVAFSLVLLGFAKCSEANDLSVCYGTVENGRLENGVKLPVTGASFQAYSWIGAFLGRTYVHSTVNQIVLETYDNLSISNPDKHFVYGETGWRNGGRFRPHKTHQNGLSVDFFVPVADKAERSVPLPTNLFNKFGYNIEFSDDGFFEEYKIDFDAMADHLLELKRVSEKHGAEIWRVIFDNEIQKRLFTSRKGELLKANLRFSTKKPWVRHDEHYHVDFILPCKEKLAR